MQKSLLTQNAPTGLRGGIISFDRLIQQVSKTVSTSVVGLLLITVKLSTIFWLLGLLSFISVGLMAMLFPPQTGSEKVLTTISGHAGDGTTTSL